MEHNPPTLEQILEKIALRARAHTNEEGGYMLVDSYSTSHYRMVFMGNIYHSLLAMNDHMDSKLGQGLYKDFIKRCDIMCITPTLEIALKLFLRGIEDGEYGNGRGPWLEKIQIYSSPGQRTKSASGR